MGCNCNDDNRYIIQLDNVGVDGFSPTIDFTDQTSESFKISVVDINGTSVSDAIPLYGYVSGAITDINSSIGSINSNINTMSGDITTLQGQVADIPSTYLSKTEAASTYLTQSNAASTYLSKSDATTTYLKKDGSNAASPLYLNSVMLYNNSISANSLSGAYVYVTHLSVADNADLEIRNSRDKDIILKTQNGGKVLYNYGSGYNEIATVNQIPTVNDSTITLTQGGVTKGSFTVNSSSDVTIDLDAGGTATDAEKLVYDDGTISGSLQLNKNQDGYLIAKYTAGITSALVPPITNFIAGTGINRSSSASHIGNLAVLDYTFSVDTDVIVPRVTQYTPEGDSFTIDTTINDGKINLITHFNDDEITLEPNKITFTTGGYDNELKVVGGTTLHYNGNEIFDSSNYQSYIGIPVNLADNQTGDDKITGAKQFGGDVFLTAGSVFIQDSTNSENIGYISNSSDLVFQTYDNKNINFIPNGTGKLQYNSNEVATKNDIEPHKAYEASGSLLTDVDGLAFVKKYAHSTFDSSKFTIVGSPTITDDGVASDFSTSNYLTKSNVVTIGSSGEFHIDFKFNCGTYTSLQYIFDLYNTTSDEIILRRSANANGYTCIVFISGTGIFNQTIDSTANTIEGYIEYKNGIYTYSLNGQTKTLESSNKMNALIYSLSLGVRLASGSAGNPLINGSIDLKQFSITVDGVPVFSGNKTGTDVIDSTLSIPYTLSKTGSKIVDAAYRSRVESMYSKLGYAPYYTLSDSDFTLPMGELYGLIGQRTLRETYRNGIFYYDLYSDRTLEQGGSCTSGTAVTFLKPFADTNYVLTVPYSAKTTTGFTPSQTGDWIAKGIGEL